MRAYGFVSASDVTASGTFAYPDSAILPISTLAVRIYRSGTDDNVKDLLDLAKSVVDPFIDLYSKFRREGAKELEYRYNHDT